MSWVLDEAAFYQIVIILMVRWLTFFTQVGAVWITGKTDTRNKVHSIQSAFTEGESKEREEWVTLNKTRCLVQRHVKICKYRAYHSWQLVFRNPADFMKSVRNLPDFTWNPYKIRRISWNLYEICRISWNQECELLRDDQV